MSFFWTLINMLVLLTIIVLGSPCSTYEAYRKHGTRIPQLAAACAIEHAATQLQNWPPTNPHPEPVISVANSYDLYLAQLADFNQWGDENSSPAVHQKLQTELA